VTAPPYSETAQNEKRKTIAQVFGEIVWLFTQSPQHQNFALGDLEWLVMTPLLLRQFRVFYASERPIGVALWAFVNEEVERQLLSGNAKLASADWKSGEKLWLVEVVAPFGEMDAMIMNLKRRMFPNREITFLGIELGHPVAKTL
jgi:cytolysin-activating lysine-acyltransferase